MKQDKAPRSKSGNVLYTFEWQGGEQNSPHPLLTNSVQMSVNFHNFAELNLCLLKTYNF